MNKIIICLLAGTATFAQQSKQEKILNSYETINLKDWKLKWQDEFDYNDDKLEENWISENGPTGDFVICSRWRENAEVRDGVLELKIKKETRAGEDWTCGNVWTKETFGYGYFEAKYKYVSAYGTNNSFWLWPKKGAPKGERACEVDINEGHYPFFINTNLHNWTDKVVTPSGRVSHESDQIHHTPIGKPVHEIKLDRSVSTKKLRLISDNPASIQITEFRLFNNLNTFPDAEDTLDEGFVNLAATNGASIKTNGNNWQKLASKPHFATDEKFNTRWVSKGNKGQKWIEFSWDTPQTIDAIQFLNGWLQADGLRRNLISDYKIQIWENDKWNTIYTYDAAKETNFGEEYHTYGVAWDQDYFKFYFDGKLYRKVRNKVCFSETNILLSLAILKASYAGPVTDELDGKSMKIDYVRFYESKKNKQKAIAKP